jgi:hypothetical protein
MADRVQADECGCGAHPPRTCHECHMLILVGTHVVRCRFCGLLFHGRCMSDADPRRCREDAPDAID